MSAIFRRITLGHKRSGLERGNEDRARADRPAPASTFGLRVVNPQVDAGIDIVFVHGLTGGRESTWTAEGAAACWPELLLPDELPQAKIIMYGYDANVVNFWSMASQNTIGDHSQKLLSSLANLRDNTDGSTRPLAFVAHSLGGIVCQDALLKSRGSADRHTQRILEYTSGILFMGTPHCGSGLAEWAVVGSKFLQWFRRVNQGTLEVLQQKSEVMARIKKDFHTMLRDRDQSEQKDMAIICFYEELPVVAVGLVVPKDSATLDRYTAIGIHANHMNMTKFQSDHDPDYRNVLCELQRFTSPGEQYLKAQQTSASTASSTYSESRQLSHWEIHDESPPAKQQDQNLVYTTHRTGQPTKLANTYSGTFYTNGGKVIAGNEFNSGGGSMSF